MHAHASQNIVKVPLVVVDDGPAASPAWEAVDLGHGAGADDWDGACGVTD